MVAGPWPSGNGSTQAREIISLKLLGRCVHHVWFRSSVYLNSFLQGADRVGGDQPREPDFQGEKVRLTADAWGGGKEEEAVHPLGRVRTICPLG